MRHDDPNMIPGSGEVAELVVNLDDVTGQIVGDAMDRLLLAGALDVWTTPIGMKKQRPGVMLSVLCEIDRREEMAAMMLELTGSFGVRFRTWQRLTLDRRHVTVKTSIGEVRLKVGELDGRVVSVQPEFEDVKKLAESTGLTVRDAMRSAQAAGETWKVTASSGAK